MGSVRTVREANAEPGVRLSASLLLLSLASSAWASDWSSFEATFPTNPCADGWAACLVDGRATDAEPRANGGVPEPSDLRVGWFDLEATDSFSPFDGLSGYAAPPRPAPRVVPSADPVPAPVAHPPQDPAPPLAPPSAPPAAGDDDDDALAAVDLPAQEALDPDQEEGCAEPAILEPRAMLGTLTATDVRCLDEALVAATRPTEMDRLSRLLMSQAFASGDRAGWAERVAHHLEHIDQSDPDLCYKYALFLAGSGTGRATEAIRWADVALERRSVWTGEQYKERVHGLYRLRARAAARLWHAAESEHAASPSTGSQDSVQRTRSFAKVTAREWHEYAVLAGKDPSAARQLCDSAAGTADYCAP